MPKNYQIGDTNYVFPDNMSDADIQANLQSVLPKTAGTGKTGTRLKGEQTPGVFGKYIAPAATAAMLGGPILGEAAGIPGVAAAARAAKGGVAGAGGAAEGFSESMAGVKGIGAKLGNIGEALGRAVSKAKLRAQQATNPPRPAPAWKDIQPESKGLPEVNAIPQTRTPSGRATTPAPSAPYAPPPSRSPQWRGVPEASTEGLPEVQAIPQSRTPSGRSTSPAPKAPYAPPPERTPLWKQVEQTPKPSPKAELKPPSAEPATPKSGTKFEPSAARREAVARNTTLAKVLHEGGISSKQATAEMDAEHWKFLAEQMGLKVPTKNQIPEIIKQIEQLEQAAPIAAKSPIPSPAHRLNPPEGPGG